MTQKELKDLQEENVELVNNLIASYVVSPRKERIEQMIESIADRYFTAPASVKNSMHCAFVGGLVHHSVEVTKTMMKLNKMLKADLPEDSIIIVGLFHDLGKIGTFDGRSFYIPQDDDWRMKKLGEMYTYNKEIEDCLTHSQRSVRLLSMFGVDLTEDEYAAILGHDGPFIDQNKGMEMMHNANPLLRITNFADSWNCWIVERTS